MSFEFSERVQPAVPANEVEQSLHQALRDNNIRPEQEQAILHHHYHGPHPAAFEQPRTSLNATEIVITNPYK
jgi:hypothetical protein